MTGQNSSANGKRRDRADQAVDQNTVMSPPAPFIESGRRLARLPSTSASVTGKGMPIFLKTCRPRRTQHQPDVEHRVLDA